MSEKASASEQFIFKPPAPVDLSGAVILGRYDHPSIGNEFAAKHEYERDLVEHQMRRSKLQVENWKEKASLSDSQRIPKSSLKKSCQYETKRANCDAMVTWSVFFIIASLAGIMGGLAISHFAM